MKALLSLVFLSLTFAIQAKVFTIDQGGHYSSPVLYKIFWGTKMSMNFMFDESARYEFSGKAVSDQPDTNKLYGFADCSGSHMENSARFGWRWYNGGLEIMAFTHKDGKYKSKYMTTIQLNRPYDASIELSDDRREYIFTVDGITVRMDRGCDSKKAKGYHLQPFFGGQQPAPHEVKIQVTTQEDIGPVYVDIPYPNPSSNGKFNLKVEALDNSDFYIIVYDTSGRLMFKSAREVLREGEQRVLSYDLGSRGFAAGMYFIVPVTVDANGKELRAGIDVKGSGKSMKLVIINH